MTVLRSDSGETHVRRHATWGMYVEVDLSCIEAEMKDTSLGRLIFFALQGLRFHSLLALPDGGPSVRNELAQKIEEMIDNAH